MPTQTFFNLPAQKRQRIVEVAIDEFSEAGFSEASINRIVKHAGIARGSFYQYFEGKEDLFFHVVELLSQQKLDVCERIASESAEQDLYANILGALPEIFKWADQHEKYNRIGLLLVTENYELFARLSGEGSAGATWLMKLLESWRDSGEIRSDLDLKLLTELLVAVAFWLLREYYRTDCREDVAKKVQIFFDILTNGIRTRAEGGR
ncbi:MAG: TetR/AcrR family transcriptional regulator [Clostridiales bacterium]|nr:TetR/AcrR family transcriptional regulator [Clostridiales bacterium]